MTPQPMGRSNQQTDGDGRADAQPEGDAAGERLAVDHALRRGEAQSRRLEDPVVGHRQGQPDGQARHEQGWPSSTARAPPMTPAMMAAITVRRTIRSISVRGKAVSSSIGSVSVGGGTA